MAQIYKNKILAEFTREELEEEFLKNCEILDSRASQIIQLEQKAQYLSSRLSRLTQDMEDPTRNRARFTGSQAPSAFHQSQMNARELQNQIGVFQRELGQRQVQRDNIARQVKYFKSLQNFSTFRTRTAKSTRSQATSRLTRDDIRRAVEQLLAKKTVPQMNNRLLATIAVLKGDYKAAEKPLHSLMKSIGESVSLYECLERRKQLRDRESKISQLSNKLEELKQRYNELLGRQKEQIDQYKSEADQNKQRNQEVINLQREKETKEMEAAKTAELKIVADGLRSEIELLENQKAKLQGDNNERQMRVQTQVQDALSQLRLEIQELEEKCKSIRETNASLEKQAQDLEQSRNDAVKRRGSAEDKFKGLQTDYKTVVGTFNKMVETSEADPFDDQRFVIFLSQMANKQWDPQKVKELSEELDKLSASLQKLKDKIAKYESAEAQMSKRISTKREEISSLETQLRALANDLGQTSGDDAREKPQYTEGANHIEFTQENKDKIGPDQTAIIILFRDFKLSPSFIGKKPSQIFLVVDFLEHKSMTTKFVDPNSDSFDSSIFFVCKNDFILKAYLEKSAVPVQLCRSRDEQVTEAGQTELNLLPFLDNVLAFTSTVKIWNESGKAIGKVTFEAALYSPLQQ